MCSNTTVCHDVMSCDIVDRNWVSTVMETSCQHLIKMTHWLISSLVLSSLWRLRCLLNMPCSDRHILVIVPSGTERVWLSL